MPARIVRRRSPIDGNGVFATVAIETGTKLTQYRGRLRTPSEIQDLYENGSETGHTFLFTLNDNFVIDANFDGNIARWINHSCEPNCEATLYEHGSGGGRRDKIVIESLRPLAAGEELTIDYQITLDVRHTPRLKRIWQCRCGSPQCSGTMLRPKRGQSASASA